MEMRDEINSPITEVMPSFRERSLEALKTDFSSLSVKTNKTAKTDLVSNADFLHHILNHDAGDARLVVVSFAGDPSRISKKAWFGRPWEGTLDLPDHANNYFSLAAFKPDDLGQYRRQKARFQGLYALMLDDVGSKVAMERLTLPPSWLLETSPGNYQAGYLLSNPIWDGAIADRLMHAIVAAGLCDPGANGPCARLARLPVAVNGKYQPSFQCRMCEWTPQLRYSVDELISGLQLEIELTKRPRPQRMRPALESPIDGDPVWLPRPNENTILVALRERGLYKVPLGEGKHDITCPWMHEHTDALDSGTAYFEPDDHWPIGGFKCQHGHCSDRHIRELLSYLDINVSSAHMKSTIRVVAGEMHRVVDASERELEQSRRYYQRGGLIVTVATDPSTRETRVREVTQPALVRALANVAIWERFDGRAKDWMRCDPPARHVAVLFDSISYPHLPVLNGITRQPYFRQAGTLMTSAGYDVATGMFGVFDTRAFSVPEHPTRKQAMEALEVLKDLLKEFSFASEHDLAAALAAMLTASIRASLSVAPMFHVRAHMVGSGKSYLCELITAFATPQRGTPTNFPADDEECRKLLLAEFLRAPAVVEFDNLTSDLLAHKSLCTALTSEFMSGRILGLSRTATVSTRALFLSSGNNVGPVKDMIRRCITINLSPQCEVPAARTFDRPNLLAEVLHERGRYVSAALTIVRAWMVAGKPKNECKSMASFGEWSDLCRQPLLWLGLQDPTASVFVAIAEDPDRETLARFLWAWHGVFGKTPAMVRDAVRHANAGFDKNNELREVLRDIADERGEINRRKVGWWIRRNSGRIVDGLRIMRASGNRSAEAWRVDRVESVSPVLSVSNLAFEKNVENQSNAYVLASGR